VANTPRKWFDQSQPQTLQAAVMFSYLNAAISLFYLVVFGAGLSLILLVLGGAAYGIANEKRWAYWLAVVVACLYLALQLIGFVTFSHGLSGLLNLFFAGILVVLLLHPQSRAYRKVWFR
jgi:uncharacterized membrane protein (DUF2068 family)